MKTILVASKNPVKVQAVQNGFERIFPDSDFRIHTLSLPSGVREQPTSDGEALQGALNRANRAMETFPQADFWVGVEGGVEERGEHLAAFAWIVVRSQYVIGRARTGTFFLPPVVAQYIRQGMELGEADDLVFNRSNSKQGSGAIGLLTGDVVDRVGLYEQAVILALVPFRNPDLYHLLG